MSLRNKNTLVGYTLENNRQVQKLRNGPTTISGSLTVSGSTILSGTTTFKDVIDIEDISHKYHIRSITSHLILSSSIGSIVHMSSTLGAHKRSTTTLPVGSISMSGAIIWVDNVKQFAIYGPHGWTRVLTGSVVS